MTRKMVTVNITLQLKRQVWYVVACDVDVADTGNPLILPAPPKRKFLSPEAAVAYIKRMVAGLLKHQRDDATGAEISCCVKIRAPR